MSARPPRGRLVRKLLVATVVPSVAVLAVFGTLAYEVARQSFEDELGKRLATAAAGAALLVFPAQIAAIGAGDEGSDTAANLRRQVERARAQLGVRRVLLVAPDLTGRADSAGRVALGARAHELGADAVEIERAAGGQPTASPLFWGRDGRPYKRAYAAVRGSAVGGGGGGGAAAAAAGGAAALVMVEGTADYFVSLAAFRRRLLAGGAVGAALIILFASLVAARITGPVGRLAAAAERIGAGNLEAAVPVETSDEIGWLAGRLDGMRAALAARDERLQMMLAGIAHEVRNPLGGLELYAGLLREGLAGHPERLAEVARIEREIAYLGQVVTEFLEYARRPPPHPERFPVRPLLEEVAEIAAAAAPAAAVTVDSSPADLVCLADRGQLRRALVNLARNAAAAAGPSGRVVLAAKAAADGAGESAHAVAWEVRDSGAGVPEELRQRIFTPFFTTREKGTGLGLAFVREIVRDHGGEIEVDRAPEGGARFRFRTG